MEAATKIRFSAKIQGAKREKAEAEARANVEAYMKEKLDRKSKAREEKVKAEADTVERARAWDEAKAKEKA